MKTIMKLTLALVLAISLGSCKDKETTVDVDASDTITVVPDDETTAVDTIQSDSTDDENAGVTKGEIEHVP